MTSSPGGSISSDSGRELFRGGGEGGGGVGLYRSLQKGAGSLNIKIVLLIKEKQISQVKELRAFLCLGGWKVWAYWNLSVHMHLNYLGPESCIFSDSPTPQLLGAHCQRGCAWWLLDSRRCFSWMPFSSVQFSRSVVSDSLWPQGQQHARLFRNSHLEGRNGWWLWQPCLLIWQEILHFSKEKLISEGKKILRQSEDGFDDSKSPVSCTKGMPLKEQQILCPSVFGILEPSPCFRHDLALSACVLSHFSHVQLCVALWTAARQAPLPMGFSRQEYWSRLPCPPPRGSPSLALPVFFPRMTKL